MVAFSFAHDLNRPHMTTKCRCDTDLIPGLNSGKPVSCLDAGGIDFCRESQLFKCAAEAFLRLPSGVGALKYCISVAMRRRVWTTL